MRKTVFILIFLSASGVVRGADSVLLSVGASFLRHADASYRATYGGGAVQPEFEIGVRVYRGLYVIGGYGAISGSGKIPDLGWDCTSTQSYLSLGLGYIDTLKGRLKFKLEAGLADLMYTEDALDSKFSGYKLGYQAEAGLLVMGKIVFVELKAGYTAASDAIGDVEFKLGGARFGLLAGVRL